MSVWQRLRAMLEARPKFPGQHAVAPEAIARRRVERAVAKADRALERRQALDAEVDRVERVIRGPRWMT